ncbi:MAG: hypothetical protein WBY66_16075, partial [Candidatus Acidiferrales bacterium]
NGRLLDPAKSASYGAAFLWIANLRITTVIIVRPYNGTSKSMQVRFTTARIKPQTLGRKVKGKKSVGTKKKCEDGKNSRAAND